jgi:hypothetical protein
LGLVAALLALAGGCEQYRIETVLHPDGSVERAVYQPESATPEEARKAQLWEKVTHAPSPDEAEKQGWSGKVRDLPILEPSKDRKYFAAWGKFPSAQRVPEHVLIAAPEGSNVPPGKLVRTQARNDLVFVTEHRWTETLTDVVTLDGLRKGRDEAADLVLALGRDVFDEALGKEYDGSGLFKWLQADGKAWLAEVSEQAFVYSAVHKGPQARRALDDQFLDSMPRLGLNLKAQGKVLEDDELNKVLEEFVVKQLVKHVRLKKDGSAVDAKTASAWVKEIAEATDEDEKNKGKPNRFRDAAEKVVAAKYGGKEALEKRVASVLPRVLGLHRHLLFGTDRHFVCTLTVPGEVVETNGRLLAGNRVGWRFEGADAWPLGYEMACRSVEVKPAAQKELLGGQPLADREAVLRFCDLAASVEGLPDALRACRDRKSTEPLYELRKKDPAAEPVMRLLKLPAK